MPVSESGGRSVSIATAPIFDAAGHVDGMGAAEADLLGGAGSKPIGGGWVERYPFGQGYVGILDVGGVDLFRFGVLGNVYFGGGAVGLVGGRRFRHDAWWWG